MKQASVLFVLCVMLGLTAMAQSPAATPTPQPTVTENKTQRITIVTKKVDDNGQTVMETFIAEGEKPEEILKKMAINPEVMQKVEIETTEGQEDGERLFLFRSAGGTRVVEGLLSDEDIKLADDDVIVITKVEEGTGLNESQKIMTITHDGPQPKAFTITRGPKEKTNCAALGVYVSHSPEDTWGARINSIIEKGGAQEAGLQQGDVIKNIDEFDIQDFPSLHFALSHYKAGDKVDVRFEREGKTQHASVTLKGWEQIPGHEFRAPADCPQEEEAISNDGEQTIDDPDGLSAVPEIQPLELEDASIFPNPTDGVFALNFKANPGPITISIVDANGKTVYKEDQKDFAGRYSNEINIKDFPQGNYVISVKQGEKVYTRLIAKQ